jgi:hypothetical protein
MEAVIMIAFVNPPPFLVEFKQIGKTNTDLNRFMGGLEHAKVTPGSIIS